MRTQRSRNLARPLSRPAGWTVALALLVPVGGGVSAQDVLPPNRGGFTSSMGVPPTWRWAAGFAAGVNRRAESQLTAHVNLGLYRDLLNPMTSAAGLLTEVYLGSRGALAGAGGFDAGARLGIYSPATRLAFGAEYNAPDEEFDAFISMIHPFQRGGVLAPGGALRIDYLPGRDHSFSIGVRFPLGQRFAGRTRPRQDHVPLLDPEPTPIFLIPDSTLVEALADAAHHAEWVNRLTVPFTDHWAWSADDAMDAYAADMAVIRDHLRDGHDVGDGGARSPVAEVEAYHAALDRAFSIATSGEPLPPDASTPFGRQVAQQARKVILERVLLPYNRLLGQKKDPDSTRGLAASASAEFYEWLTRETDLLDRQDMAPIRTTTWTFAQLLDLVEEVRAETRRQWRDSRLVWLPFQLALRPEDHDEQHELSAIVQAATGERFTQGNKRWYIENDQFQAELARMIRETEDYHVLWIHDFRGFDSEGDPDEEGFRQVTEAYLPALIRRVQAYDSVGKIPQYLIFIDQMYFEANRGILWLDLLQNPLEHRVELPDGFQAWEDSIAGLQEELRRAVAGSQLMQSQALHFQDGWIENLVKVHVNVTNPPDPVFWTDEIFPFFMGLPDVIMRDHRKITFYDVSEEDPYRGMAMYTGMGVGEHYVGASWEDRSMRVQGPVLLSLKNAARQLLLNQGIPEREIPWELRPKEMAPEYARMVQDTLAAMGDWGDDMQLHNQIGFRFKAVTIFKATLYTLMPPGAVIKAPDSIWGSNLWAAMLLGHALRGGRSLLIAPALANAPSSGFPQMSRAQEALSRTVVAEAIFREELDAVGGLLKVGLYNSRLAVGDVPGKMQAFLQQLESVPWLQELYPFRPEVVAAIAAEAEALEAEGFGREDQAGEVTEPPKLHMKANYFATREAWDELLGGPDVALPFQAYFRELAKQNQALSRGEYYDPDEMATALLPPTRQILLRYASTLTPEQISRLAVFFSIGSHNQNTRSLVLDGEVALVVARWSALFGLPDFLVIVGLSEWIDDLDEMEALFPEYRGLKRRISRLIRIAV